MTTFFPGVLSMPTSGRIIKIDNSEMPKPTAVFVIASINECFLDCIFSFNFDFNFDFNFAQCTLPKLSSQYRWFK